MRIEQETREAAKQEPLYKTKGWLSWMANFLGTLIELQAQVKSATKVPQTIRTFYGNKFKGHELQLTNKRSNIEAAFFRPTTLGGLTGSGR